MRRTQIYLTEVEHSAAAELARTQKRTLSDVIREALDQYLRLEMNDVEQLQRLRTGFGMWKDREDLPDFDQIRRDWFKHAE
jgi:Arc/MetJ-type ribon-helix-helix transcriptional regulator